MCYLETAGQHHRLLDHLAHVAPPGVQPRELPEARVQHRQLPDRRLGEAFVGADVLAAQRGVDLLLDGRADFVLHRRGDADSSTTQHEITGQRKRVSGFG